MKKFSKNNSILKAVIVAGLLLASTNVVLAQAQLDTAQHINTSTKNSGAQQQKPYVILISADGFRHDYAK
jgi:hypothetical protein